MNNYGCTLLITLLASVLFSQEQVSDFTKYGVYEPTNLTTHLGFAQIDDEQYMLQENDSLTIFKWSGDKFTPLHVIPRLYRQALNNIQLQPNRSSMIIRDNKYYRLFERGIQVIDIPTGVIESEYESVRDQNGWDQIYPAHIHEDRFYFREQVNFETYSMVVNMSTMDKDTFDFPFYSYNLIGDTYYNYNPLTFVQVLNLTTGQDSIISFSPERLQTATISTVDSCLIGVDVLGDVWSIKEDFSTSKTDCNTSAYPGLQNIMVNGSKLIAYYKDGEESHTIVVWNLNTGDEELQFKVDSQNNTRQVFESISNESPNEGYSIFGFYGFIDASGNLAGGNYYLIDHQDNSFTLLPEVKRVRSFTPFLYKENIYFACFDTDSDLEFLARYNITNKKYVKLDVDDNTTTSVTLGYPIYDLIVAATNTKEETPQVWTISPQDSFTSIQSLDYLDELGITFVRNLAPMDNRIYYSTNSGVFSTLHDTREEIGIQNNALNQSIYTDFRLSGYKDKVTYTTFDGNNAVFTVLDTVTGTYEIIEEPGPRNSLYNVREAGPFCFFKNPSSEKVQYFDNKTNEFDSLTGPTIVDPVRMTIGEEHVLLRDGSVSDQGTYNMYQVAYETNKVKNFELDFVPSKVEIGAQNAYYLVHRDFEKDSILVSIKEQNGDLSTIFRGIGRYGNGNELHAFDSKNNDATGVTFYHIYDLDYSPILVANDLEKTEVIYLPEIERARILDNYKDRIILAGEDSLRNDRFYIYQAFNPIQEVIIPEDVYVHWVSIKDNESLFLYVLNSETHLLKHDHASNTSTTHIVNDFTAYFEYREQGISISDTTHLLSISPTNTIEREFNLWVLNFQTDTLQRLDKIYGGPVIYSPDNIIRFKEWIYFTGIVEGVGRQWFRLGPPGPNTTSTLELVSDSSNLLVYPNPSSGLFYLDKDLENLYVFNMQGQLIMNLKDYHSHKAVDINSLVEGSYFVVGFDKEGRRYESKIVKLND